MNLSPSFALRSRQFNVHLIILGIMVFLAGCGGGGGGGNNDSSGPTLSAIEVSPNSTTIAMGYEVQITVTALYSDGASVDITGTVDWSSSNETVATIDGLGLVSALSVGQIVITADYQGETEAATVIITDAVLESISIATLTAGIPMGTSATYTANGNFSDGSTQDLTPTVAWVSSDPAIAEITGQGQVQGVDVGSATITATDPNTNLSDYALQDVTAAALVSISVTPADKMTVMGTTRQYTATGTFSDATALDITNQVAWNSDTPGAATINPTTGLLEGVAVGTAVISASADNITGSTEAVIGVLSKYYIDPAQTGLALETDINATIPFGVAPDVDTLAASGAFVSQALPLDVDINGDQYMLTLWLSRTGAMSQEIQVRFFVDAGGMETDLFSTVIAVNSDDAQEYVVTLTGIDPVASVAGGELKLALFRDDTLAPDVFLHHERPNGLPPGTFVNSVDVPLN